MCTAAVAGPDSVQPRSRSPEITAPCIQSPNARFPVSRGSPVGRLSGSAQANVGCVDHSYDGARWELTLRAAAQPAVSAASTAAGTRDTRDIRHLPPRTRATAVPVSIGVLSPYSAPVARRLAGTAT